MFDKENVGRFFFYNFVLFEKKTEIILGQTTKREKKNRLIFNWKIKKKNV